MNPVEWLIYAAANYIHDQGPMDWCDLPLATRKACWWVIVYGHRCTTPWPNLKPLIDALQGGK